MTKQTIIPAGYRITVVSWENDADNYNTETVEGYSELEAKFAVELFKAFSSCNNRSNRGIGNLSGRDGDQEKYDSTIQEIVSRHPIALVSEGFKDYFTPSADGYHGYSEYLHEIGLGGTEYSISRVCESVKVEYVAQDIYIEDVTEEFV